MGSRIPGSGDLGPIVDPLKDHGRRLTTLETASGTRVRSLVDQVRTLAAQVREELANIRTTVANAIRELSYTREETDQQINQKVASTPGDATVNGQHRVNGSQSVRDNQTIEGSQTINGAQTVNGSARAGSYTTGGEVTGATGVFDSGLRSQGARNLVVVNDRATAWLQGDGQLGIAPSSRRFKTDIAPWSPVIRRLLDVRGVWFRYDATKFTDQFIDPEAPREVGFIAEELVEAGFPEFVFSDSDGEVQGINYDRIVVALLELAREQDARIAALELISTPRKVL